jgi:hypothetical protein
MNQRLTRFLYGKSRRSYYIKLDRPQPDGEQMPYSSRKLEEIKESVGKSFNDLRKTGGGRVFAGADNGPVDLKLFERLVELVEAQGLAIHELQEKLEGRHLTKM